MTDEKKGIHVYILPNIFTTGNMFFGFLSIIHSLKSDFIVAAYAIVGAAVFDTLDGRVARLTRSTSKFGMEYDSLSDLISFGVAPAILMYLWALQPFERIGWLACFVYMACGALRLARFNVQAQTVEKRYFQGLPIPMAAGIVATSVTAAQSASVEPQKNIYALVMAVVLGILMVSNFRYRNFKELDFRRRKPFFILILGLIMMVVIFLKPEVNLFIAFIVYALLGAVFGILTPAGKKISRVLHKNKNPPDITKS